MDKDTIKYVLNILREGTITWSGRAECLKRARRQKVEGIWTKKLTTRKKYYWVCSKCGEEYRDESSMEVDHISEVGAFKGDWGDFINRLYCGQENLQVLCVTCHKKKTSNYNATKRFVRKP